MYEVEYKDANGTSSIQFNICAETARQCPDMMDDHANMVNSVGTCHHLSRISMEGEQKPGALSLISEKNKELGVILKYQDGNKCNETAYYSLTI